MPLGEQINRNSGATKPTVVEASEHEREVYAKRTMKVPANYQIRVEYDGSNNPLYIGYAPRGEASSASAWLIQKFTYSGTNMTLRQIAYNTWDNRASASYS